MDDSTFFTAVCQAMGWAPSPWRLAVFHEWHNHEGMPLESTWNPIATTWLSPNTPLNLGFDIGHGPGNWNSVPVRVYVDFQSGVNATVQTLQQGYYPNIRRCFEDETGYQEAVSELATYVGSVSYGQSLVDYMRSIELPDPRVDTILQTLQSTGIEAWQANGNEPIINTIGNIQNQLATIVTQLQAIQSTIDAVSQQAYGTNNLMIQWRAALMGAIPGLVL